MAVLVPGKILYLANPRTASCATLLALSELPGAVRLWPQHQTLDQCKEYNGEFAFTTVRNPYDVLTTWYEKQSKYKTFLHFLTDFNHIQFLLGPEPELFWQCCDEVTNIRWENLEPELNAILRKFDLPTVTLVLENVTHNKKPWREYYTDVEFRAANERFGHILDRHNYPRIEP